MEDFEKLKSLRGKLRMSQTDFAVQLGVSRELLSGMENGKSIITNKTKRLLKEKFAFDIDAESENENIMREDTAPYGNKSIEVHSTPARQIKLLWEQTISQQAAINVILMEVENMSAQRQGKMVSSVSAELRRTIKTETDRLFELYEKKLKLA